jgi:hypothetical protein
MTDGYSITYIHLLQMLALVNTHLGAVHKLHLQEERGRWSKKAKLLLM